MRRLSIRLLIAAMLGGCAATPPMAEAPSGDMTYQRVETAIAAQLAADSRTCSEQGFAVNTLDHHLCLRNLAAQRRAAVQDAIRAQQERERREHAGWCQNDGNETYVRCQDI